MTGGDEAGETDASETGATDAQETDQDSTERVHVPDLAGEGRSALFAGEPHTVCLALEAGEEIPPHRHPDREIVCHVLEGDIAMTLDEKTHDLTAGDVLRFDGDREISPAAKTDAVALLVLAERAE